MSWVFGFAKSFAKLGTDKIKNPRVILQSRIDYLPSCGRPSIIYIYVCVCVLLLVPFAVLLIRMAQCTSYASSVMFLFWAFSFPTFSHLLFFLAFSSCFVNITRFHHNLQQFELWLKSKSINNLD